VTADLAFEAIFDFGGVLDVIDVAVGKQQHFQIDTAGVDPVASTFRRIKENPAFGRGNEIAVRFENPTAERFVSHPIDSNRDAQSSQADQSGIHQCRPQVDVESGF